MSIESETLGQLSKEFLKTKSEIDDLNKLISKVSKEAESDSDLLGSMITKVKKQYESDIDALNKSIVHINKLVDNRESLNTFKKSLGDINVQIKEIEKRIEEVRRTTPDKGNPGIKGDKGDRGSDGLDGIDGKQGKSGKSGSPDTPEKVRDKLSTLTGDERLSADYIKDIDKAIDWRNFKQSSRDYAVIELSDTPRSYTGFAGKYLAVRTDERGVEFIDGGGTSFNYTQVATSTDWLITHNLGTKNLIVYTYSDTNEPLIYNDITFVDDNIISINFTAAISGRAVILSSGGISGGGGGTSDHSLLTNLGYAASGHIGFQESLVSGTNIKTVNSNTLLGNGDISVATLIGYTPYNSTNPAGYISGITGSDVTTALGYTPENVANKATTFGTINDTLYPSVKAVNDAIISAVVGLLDYRGSYNASTNLFPATGGSGTLGAILKGDFWICSVAGTLGGINVTPGDLIISLIDTPGQTSTNWDLIQHDLGYVPENVANKENTTLDTSMSKYPTNRLVKEYNDNQNALNVLRTELPKRGSMWGDEMTALIAKSVASNTTSSNQIYNLYSYLSGYANGDTAGWGFLCKAGNYIFDILHIKASGCGLADFYIDGSLIASGQDTYNATTIWNQHFIINVSGLSAGYHTFKYIVNGKNVLSTAYLFGVTKVSFKQSSD